jgi:hypothetical protein
MVGRPLAALCTLGMVVLLLLINLPLPSVGSSVRDEERERLTKYATAVRRMHEIYPKPSL